MGKENKKPSKFRRRVKTARIVPGALWRKGIFGRRAYDVIDRDALKLEVILTADLHTDGDIVRDRTDKLRRALAGISDTKRVPDALLIAGDVTNSAHDCEYKNLRQLLKFYNRIPRIIPAMGNHDCRGTDMEPIFEIGCDLFQEFCAFCGYPEPTDSGVNYYVTEVGDYTFIQLGTDELRQNEAVISEAQLAFLDRELERAEAKGLPVFVTCHQPLNDVPGVLASWPDGGLGEQSDAVKAILQKHAERGMTILYIFGHLHSHSDDPVGVLCEYAPNLYTLNLPSLEYCDDATGGVGYVLEAYEDQLRLRCRSFIKNIWIGKRDYTIPLKK